MKKSIAAVAPAALPFLALVATVFIITGGKGAPLAHGDLLPEESFAVLTEGDEPSTELEDVIEEVLSSEWITAYDLDLEAAVAAETETSGTEVAVVPGADGVCIVSETVGGCGTWVDAELGMVALVEACSPGLDPGEVRVTGLVPDEAAEAVITRPPAAGVDVSAPLNVYEETFTGDPEEIASSGLAGPAGLPWDASDESLTICVVPDEEQREESDEE